MEQNEESKAMAAQEHDSVGCSCGCGGGKNSNRAVIAIWVVLLIGFACLVIWTRMNADSRLTEPERLLKQACELYEQQKIEAGAECMRQSAELGNAVAQLYYGGILKRGIGVEQDMPAAVEWFRKAADQGFPVAFYELGVCCENGEGVEQNLDEAEAWYKKAMDSEGDYSFKSYAQEALARIETQKTKSGEGTD